MKHLAQFITEKQNFLVNKKIDKKYNTTRYFPQTKEELQDIIKQLLDSGETNLNCIDISNNITNMTYLFGPIDNIENANFDVSEWDVSNVTDMSYMFHDCKNFDCDLSSWDVSNVTDMQYMFKNCYKLKGNGLDNWDVSNVKNMNRMFKDCKNFEGNGLENWNVKNVKTMSSMFYGCNKLKNIPSWYKD